MRLDDLVSCGVFPGDKLHVYYCESCSLILAADTDPFEGTVVAYAAGWMCPDCGSRLENSLRLSACDGNGFERFVDPRLDASSLRGKSRLLEWSSKEYEVTQSVAEETHQRSKLSSRLFLYHGRGSRRRLHLECVRAALDGRVVFLDGGNSFSSLLLREAVLELDALPEVVMDRILVSRAFNFHQFTSLVTKKLPDALSTYTPLLVALSEPTLLYEEDGADKREAWFSFRKMAFALRRITIKLSEETTARTVFSVSNISTRAGQILRSIAWEGLETVQSESRNAIEHVTVAHFKDVWHVTR